MSTTTCAVRIVSVVGSGTLLAFNFSNLEINVLSGAGAPGPTGAMGPMGPTGSSTSPAFLSATLVTPQTTNIAAADHIKFDTVGATDSSGSIVLDTTTTYSNSTNTASIGRVTLQPNLTYILSSELGVTQYTALNSSMAI